MNTMQNSGDIERPALGSSGVFIKNALMHTFFTKQMLVAIGNQTGHALMPLAANCIIHAHPAETRNTGFLPIAHSSNNHTPSPADRRVY